MPEPSCEYVAGLIWHASHRSVFQQQFELDPFTNTLFLFCGRRRDRIKGLYWEKDGFILLYKRLEQGAYQWPRSESEVMLLLPTFQAGAGVCRADTGGAI